jgi:hypothetical protein
MSLREVYPYFKAGTWMFDHASVGLREEAFVNGADAVLTRLVHLKAIPAAERGFTLRFSDEPFDGADAELKWVRGCSAEVADADAAGSSHGGNWYSCTVADEVMQGWLCDSLLLFFSAPAARIYIKVEPLPPGVEPKCRLRDHGPVTDQTVNSERGASPSKVLFLDGLSSDGAAKTGYLWSLGYAVRTPKLSDWSFDAALHTAQKACDEYRLDVIVGSSRGGAVAMAMQRPETPLVLLTPAWRLCGVSPTVSALEAVVIHSRGDRWVPIRDSTKLCLLNPFLQLVKAGRDHRLNDPDARAALSEALEHLLRGASEPNRES